MKHFIYFFIYLLVACKNYLPSKKVKQFTDNKNTYEEILEENIQTLHWDTLSINQVKMNKHSFHLNRSFFENSKIDSTSIQLWQCGNPFNWKYNGDGDAKFKHFFTKKLEYVIHKNDVRLVGGHINNNILELIDRNYILTKETKISDFKLFFPISFKRYLEEKETNPDIFSEYDYIQISFDSTYPEHQWFFYFDKKGYLIKFKLYWWLC